MTPQNSKILRSVKLANGVSNRPEAVAVIMAWKLNIVCNMFIIS